MTQKSKLPALPLIFAAAFAIAGALASAASAETALPRVLSLGDRTEAALPGDTSGHRLGILIHRGSGFPEPAVAPPEPEAAQAEVIVPTRPVLRRSRREY